MMEISTRNQIEGTVKEVREGALNAMVMICRGNHNPIEANVTMEFVKQTGLEPGKKAIALIDAGDVTFALKGRKEISACNQIEGTITRAVTGPVNGTVTIEDEHGTRITGRVTNEAITRNGFARGGHAVAIVKATDVVVAAAR